MGDHLCSAAPEPPRLPEPGFRFQATPPGTGTNGSSNSIDLLKPSRTAPPRIDPQVANRPFMRQDQLTPNSNSSDSRDPSPVTPFPGPYRNAASTLPRPLRPPTPELEGNLDCAFPPFPGKTPRTAPTDSRKGVDKSRMDQLYTDPSPLYAPLSPRATGGDNVLQRMNAIAPGPFGVQSRTFSADQPGETTQGPSHQRNQSSKHDATPPNRDGPRTHSQRPSTAGSEKSQRRIGFDGSEFRKRAFFDQTVAMPWSEKQDAPVYQGRPQLPEEGRPEMENEGLRLENRSRTFPLENRPKTLPRRPTDQSLSLFDRSTSTPGSLGPNNYGNGSHEPRGREPPRSRDQEGLTYHTPTLSRSSNGSGSGSDARTASSRSTPPATETYRKSRRRPSDTSNIDSLMKEIQTSMKVQQPTDTVMKEPEIQLPKPPEIPDSLGDPRTNGGELSPKDPRDTPFKGVGKKSPYRLPTASKGNCRGCGEPIKGKSALFAKLASSPSKQQLSMFCKITHFANAITTSSIIHSAIVVIKVSKASILKQKESRNTTNIASSAMNVKKFSETITMNITDRPTASAML
ncbi:hypothetical protein FGG08_000743 [Glutinoglossum americanum]|uniref:Uncharacterized protein n=1 Tax=Glutinoglossum americanum TaxID=1670608 RepID=A0A9P8I389_9PEZI|nr:hypothetical protein FGG08_000743 [Glutinoglossum americanum]